MGEHRTADDVADRVDSSNIGGEMRIDDDLPALRLDAERLQTQAFGERAPADGDKHHVGVDRLGLAAGRRLDRRLDARPRCLDFGQLVTEVESKALLFQRALHQLGGLAVDPRQDTIQELDHRHFGTQPAPDRAEFEADDAGADDDQLLRRLRQAQGARRGDDRLLVDLDARQPRDIRAGGDDDRLGLERALLAVSALDDHAPRRGDPALVRSPSRSCSS